MPDPAPLPLMTFCELCGEELGFGSLSTPEERALALCTACLSPNPAEPPPSRQQVRRALVVLRLRALPAMGLSSRHERRPTGISRSAWLRAREMHDRLAPMGTRVPIPAILDPQEASGAPAPAPETSDPSG